MTQAIQTKYLGPTNVRGSRIKATAFAGSVIVAYDHSLNVENNHKAAAKALCDKMGWQVDLVSGELADGTYAHTMTDAFKVLLGLRQWVREGRNNGNPWRHKEVRDAFTCLAQHMGLTDWNDV
jgi:hypothetical protein